jgi:hypothetical protein
VTALAGRSNAVASGSGTSKAAWRRRLERDRARAEANQTREQRRITAELLSRALDAGAEAFALTGSTARNRRTTISDLDYHVIGPRPSRIGLSDEVDVVASGADELLRKLRSGDDYVQWTLRFGCILLDRTDIFWTAARVLAAEWPWPDTTRKRARLPSHRRHAERLIEIGDRDAAHEQVRAALTAAARAVLLDAGIFPLSRTELPGQLRATGFARLAAALRTSIDQVPSLRELGDLVEALGDADPAPSRPQEDVNERHVARNEGGGWDVYRPGAPRVSSRHRTQREAVGRAREILLNSGGGEIVVHARDGRVRDRDSIGSARS